MRVLVIGANGNTATRLVRRLAEGPHDPVAMIRDPAQRPKFDAWGVTVKRRTASNLGMAALHTPTAENAEASRTWSRRGD